ncbi:MAG: ELM1/GtrOC1 family putative glycosyltransferase [Pseudomonadota bacterium]
MSEDRTVWLIDAYRAGEQSQVRALVEALPWHYESKTLAYRKNVVAPHVLGRSSLRGITKDSKALLKPPWPDLVVTCGVRNEPVCRWIREQSGGRTRYVHVGRPWGPLRGFDLVITTPQYRVEQRSNVLNNTLTLHSVTDDKLLAARQQWLENFEQLPAPRFAIIVGGNSGPFTFGPVAASRLAHQASAIARQSGGSLLVSTSSRTDGEAVTALECGIDVPRYFYRWAPNDPGNPYFGMLAVADQIIVSGDSIAMLSEACATGKPVKMFDLGGMRGASDIPVDFRLGATLYRWLMRFFWQHLSRDITLVHQQLRDAGRAFWLEEELGVSMVPAETDMQRAVSRVKALFR